MSTTRFEEVSKKIKREADVVASDRMSRRNLLGPVGTLNTVTPCAACKLLRRRCAQECTFAPYFSPHEPQKFAAVHKVFGASNVSKMLMEVPEPQRVDAANSLVYEANVRLRDPIYGCMGAILALQQQLHSLEVELAAVRAETLKHTFRQNSASINIPSSLIAPNSSEASAAAWLPPPPPQATSSSSSMYTPPSNSRDYSSISNEHVAFFG